MATNLIADILASLPADKRNWLAGVPDHKSAKLSIGQGRTLIARKIAAGDVEILQGYGVDGNAGQMLYSIIGLIHDDYDSDHGSMTCWCPWSNSGHKHHATEVY